ncbi:hypothetical protein KA977_07370 [Candidatus Dependentiae bacterium]|nr:hypothetical protein [Candidatus Dependentiae bacterium]
MKKNINIFSILFFCISIILINVIDSYAEVKTAVITNFSSQEIDKEWFEINVDAAYCLKNSVLIAEVTNKITGKTEKIKIPRIFYDYETLDASFIGSLNYNKSDVNIVLKLLNYEDETIIKTEENKTISEILERKTQEEQRNSDNEKFQEESLYFDKQRQKNSQNQSQSAEETAVVVIILLPMLLEQINSMNSEGDEN